MCFPSGTDHMLNCHDWMIKNHPWAGETHDLPDPFPHFRLIAVNLAVGAECLVFHKRAFIAPSTGIFCQLSALRTEIIFHAVTLMAIQADHQCDDLFFLISFLLRVCVH